MEVMVSLGRYMTRQKYFINSWNLPTCSPGSKTNTEYDAIKAPSSDGCNKASALGSKDLAWGTNLASVPFPSQAISGQRPNKGQRRREDANEY